MLVRHKVICQWFPGNQGPVVKSNVKTRTHGATLRATLQSCTVYPPLKLLHATLCATVAEVESAPTSATSQATVSPCVHHLQHCVQLRDAMLRAMMHCVSAPLS